MIQRKRLLTMFGCLVLALALIAVPLSSAFGAIPLGAVNRTVVVPDGINAGTYLVHDGFRNGDYAANNRLVSANFLWDAKTMESYVFDPSQFPDMTWHEDGFPLRATYRTPVDHLGEMKYLAQTYPEITNLRLVGYTNGIGLNASDFNPQPQYRVPLYALEICSAPGVWDGRPATLHQASNHGGELDAAELCANLAWYLCTNYGKIDAVTELINTTRIYIMPYTNGDGNMVSFRSASGGRRTNARGVDLNRNWAYRWGSNNGSSSNPGTGGNYRGASPNSEPETTAISGIYRMDNVVSSLSGHTSGQIVIFAWAFVRNPEDAHPLLTTLAKQQADLNGHTPQNGNVMYAQSGEINDYLWGSMRALGFTFEYGEGQTISYLGAADGNDYATASYLDAAGNPKIMKANYSTIANNGIGRPATDVTGRLAFLSNEHVALGYQDIPPGGKGNGINNSEFGGPLTRRVTVEMIQNEIDTNPNFDLTGKIFFSHTPASAAIGNAIAQFLKAQGAIGWLVTNTATNGGYNTFTPAYGAGADSGFPVAGILKGYAADIHERALADPTITFTFRSDRKDFSSVNYQWGRHKSAYMLNMSFAATYANHVKGTITDGAGVPLPEAALDASLLIEGKIVDLQSNVGNNPTIERPPDQQWKEWHTPHYDVVGGVYDWSMLPSKQSEYPDKGWDITASANGRYSDFANIKFDVDPTRAIANGEDPEIFADPKYQQTVDGVNFALPTAITTDFDFGKSYPSQTDITVPFSTYTLAALGQNSVKGDVSGLTVTLGGEPVTVTSLGGGDYEATFKAEKAGAYDFVIDFDSVLDHSTYSAEFNFDNFTIYLVTEESEVVAWDTVYVDVMLVGDSNYTRAEATVAFDSDHFTYAGYSDLGGMVGEVVKSGDTVKVQSVPNMNLYNGGPCITPQRLVRLKFTAVADYSQDTSDTAISIVSAVVNPQLGVTGKTVAAGDPLDYTILNPVEGTLTGVNLISGQEIELVFDEPILNATRAKATFDIRVDGVKVDWDFLSYFDFGPYAEQGGVVNVRLKEALNAGEPRGRIREGQAQTFLNRTEHINGPIAAAKITVTQGAVQKVATWVPFYGERAMGYMSRVFDYVSMLGGTNGNAPKTTTTGINNLNIAASMAEGRYPLYSDEFIARQVGEGVHRFFGRSEYLALPMVRAGYKTLLVGPTQSVYEAPEFRELYQYGVTDDTYTRKSIKATDVPGNFDPVYGTYKKPFIVATSDDVMRHDTPINAQGEVIFTVDEEGVITPVPGMAQEPARPRSDFFYLGEAFFDIFYEVGVITGSKQYPVGPNNNWDDNRYDVHIERAYEKAKAEGKWPNTDMMKSAKDYYVYGAMAFEEFIPETQAFEAQSFPVNTRGEIYDYDYDLYWALSGIHGKYEYWTGVGNLQGASTIDDTSKWRTPWFWGNQPDNYTLPATVNGAIGQEHEPLRIVDVFVSASDRIMVYFNREVRTRQNVVNGENWRVWTGDNDETAITVNHASGYGYLWKGIRITTTGTRLDNGLPYGTAFSGFTQKDLDERSVSNGGWIPDNRAVGANALQFGEFVDLDEAIRRGAGIRDGGVKIEYAGTSSQVLDWDGNELKKERLSARFEPWIGVAYRTPLTGLYIYMDTVVGTNPHTSYDQKEVAVTAGMMYESILQNNSTITYPIAAGEMIGDDGLGNIGSGYWRAFPTGSGSNHNAGPVTYDRTGQRIADGAVAGNGGMRMPAGSVIGHHPGGQGTNLSGTSVGDSFRVEGWGGTTFQCEDVLIMRDYNLCRYKNESLALHEGGHGVDSFTGTSYYANYVYRDITSAHATATNEANGRRWFSVDNVGSYVSSRGEYVSTGNTFIAGVMRESFQGNNDGTWTGVNTRNEYFRYDPWGFEAHRRYMWNGELGLWYENKVGDPDYRVMPEDWEILRDQNAEFANWTQVNDLNSWGATIIETMRHNPYIEEKNGVPIDSMQNDNIRWVSWNVPNVWDSLPSMPPSNPNYPNNRFDFSGYDFTSGLTPVGGTSYHPVPAYGSIPVADLVPLENQTHPFFRPGGVKRPVRTPELLDMVKPVTGIIGAVRVPMRPIIVEFDFIDYSGEITSNNAQTTFDLKVDGVYTGFYFWSFKETAPGVAVVQLRLDKPFTDPANVQLEVTLRPIGASLAASAFVIEEEASIAPPTPAAFTPVEEIETEELESAIVEEDEIETEEPAPTTIAEPVYAGANTLVISLVEELSYGQITEYEANFAINSNESGVYEVGPYQVYVEIDGNNQVLDCYVVE